MIARTQLEKIQSLLAQSQRLLQSAIAGMELPAPGKPPKPGSEKELENAIWAVWDKLVRKGKFTWRYVRKLVVNGDPKSKWRDYNNSYFTPILVRWRNEGWLNLVTQGRGRQPSEYQIRDS